MAQLTDVSVKIPSDRVGEFYELVGKWLSRASVAHVEPFDPQGSGLRSGIELQRTRPVDWTNSPDDLRLAEIVWSKFSAQAKGLFSTLIDHKDHKMSAVELAELLGFPNGMYSVAGILAWPVRHCSEVGRTLLCRCEEGAKGEGGKYWVEGEVAELFSTVR